MTTTTVPTTTNDTDLIVALEASPNFVAVNGPGHLAELLGLETPSPAALAILSDTALASGRERGIIAAGILERVTPDGVLIEEANLGTEHTTRAVFLYQDGPDGTEQIALHFFDRTSSVWVHVDDENGEHFDGLVDVAQMFDLVRAYYNS